MQPSWAAREMRLEALALAYQVVGAPTPRAVELLPLVKRCPVRVIHIRHHAVRFLSEQRQQFAADILGARLHRLQPGKFLAIIEFERRQLGKMHERRLWSVHAGACRAPHRGSGGSAPSDFSSWRARRSERACRIPPACRRLAAMACRACWSASASTPCAPPPRHTSKRRCTDLCSLLGFDCLSPASLSAAARDRNRASSARLLSRAASSAVASACARHTSAR